MVGGRQGVAGSLSSGGQPRHKWFRAKYKKRFEEQEKEEAARPGGSIEESTDVVREHGGDEFEFARPSIKERIEEGADGMLAGSFDWGEMLGQMDQARQWRRDMDLFKQDKRRLRREYFRDKKHLTEQWKDIYKKNEEEMGKEAIKIERAYGLRRLKPNDPRYDWAKEKSHMYIDREERSLTRDLERGRKKGFKDLKRGYQGKVRDTGEMYHKERRHVLDWRPWEQYDS